MNLIRTDKQVALNEILVGLQTTLDHYQHAAEICEQENIAGLFQKIFTRRTQLSEQLTQLVREQGELPSTPDLDRESGEQLINHIVAAFADNSTSELVSQRLEGENTLQNILDDNRQFLHDEKYQALLDQLQLDINTTSNDLKNTD